MSFSARSSSSKGKEPLNKRIPENPKYKHIKSSIDTGASATKYLERLEEIKTNYRYRKDEIFRRIKATTFAQLVLQVAEVNIEDELDTPVPTGYYDGPILSPPPIGGPLSDYPESPPDTARSTLSSVISGVGELDMSHPPTSTLGYCEVPQSPYLLLDVRYKEDFDQCHIITAKSYPAAQLSRSVNYFTKDILQYQNKPGKIIILYDEDERVAPRAAATFVQRGVDNVFMLSGGMRVLYKTFPEGMLCGVVPPNVRATPSGKARKAPASGAAGTRDCFTVHDLTAIEGKLDEALLAGSRASSRTSTAASQRSVASSRAESVNPWK